MEEQVHQLVERTWAKFQTLPPNKRLLIAISGIPGSGKTTLAKTVTTHINTVHKHNSPSSPPIATTVPMDGYHLTRSQLSSMPNPEEAIFRRGAAFTFDSEGYCSLIQQLREPISKQSEIIYAPSFDHALKDPVENDIPIPPTSRILLIEGLYLSLSSPSSTASVSNPPNPPHAEAWSQAGNLIDEHWFISTDLDVAANRLVERHLKSGICESEDVARKRVWESDLRNGKEILEFRRLWRDGVDVLLRS